MKQKRLLTVVLWGILACTHVFARQEPDSASFFQFSLCPRLGTNGPLEKEFSNILSVNLTVGVSGSERAFAVAGLANVIRREAVGVQVAGAVNYVGKGGSGVLPGGLLNVVRGDYHGVQISAGANHGQNVTGVQVAGLYNVAKQVKGVQLSFVNVAENSNCPIGLINIIKDGEKSIDLSYDFLGSVTLSFRSGGKYTYGIMGVGYNHQVKDDPLLTECGIGVHIPCCKWFRVNNELKVATIGSSSPQPVFSAGYSLLPAFKIGNHFGVFGGASLNYMTTANMNNHRLFSDQALWSRHSDTRLQELNISYQIGLQYIF